ncbi:hypothetical protein AAFC00_005434 [Neodothiora populina]|uniref:Casein kinase II beta 2 subunit n=1 Tax=Neodothiora populina TaxID=2781224 RepID=A0ABR3PLZ0_9PEZI
MPPLAGYWHSLLTRHAKVWKSAYKEACKAIKESLPKQAQTQAQPVLVRNTPKQPLHPAARLRQGRRWYSTSRRSAFNAAIRHFSSVTEQYFPSAGVKQTVRASYPQSAISSAIGRSAGRAPFASTLRPNLTGGTLGRTAGGYSLGGGRVGGARYFSHGPASQGQVVQNVSQAVRAFFLSGQKAHFDGVSPRTGEKKYRAISILQDETGRRLRNVPRATPGSYVDFSVNPTITALTSLNGVSRYTPSENEQSHINSSGLIDVLSVDFSRALKDFAAVLNDLKKISQLGDMPITYESTGKLRVHFPGCHAEAVENLCEELGVQRGVVVQDQDFEAFAGTEIALLFPFAPSTTAFQADCGFEEGDDVGQWFDEPSRRVKEKLEWHTMITPSNPSEAGDEHSSTCSARSDDEFALAIGEDNPWDESTPSTPSGYETLHYSSPSRSFHAAASAASPLEYQGLEGIYRFIEQCDSAHLRQ